MQQATRRTIWTTLTVLVLAAPAALTAWRTSEGKPLSTILVAVGVVALVAMAVSVMAPSRLRGLTAAFGIDRIIAAHRWLGMLAIGAALTHLVIAVVRSPKLLDPLAASLSIQWGWLATIAMASVGLVAAWGRRSGRRYEV